MAFATQCSRCGAQNQSGAFCAVCGAPLAAAPQQPQPPQQWPPQQPPQQQYPGVGQQPPQQPYYNADAAAAAQSSKAIIALVLGVLGFIMCGPFTTVPGIFLAKADLDAMKRGQLPPTNLQLAQIAYWMNIAISVLWLLAICAFFAFFGGLATLGGLGSLAR